MWGLRTWPPCCLSQQGTQPEGVNKPPGYPPLSIIEPFNIFHDNKKALMWTLRPHQYSGLPRPPFFPPLAARAKKGFLIFKKAAISPAAGGKTSHTKIPPMRNSESPQQPVRGMPGLGLPMWQCLAAIFQPGLSYRGNHEPRPSMCHTIR